MTAFSTADAEQVRLLIFDETDWNCLCGGRGVFVRVGRLR